MPVTVLNALNSINVIPTTGPGSGTVFIRERRINLPLVDCSKHWNKCANPHLTNFKNYNPMDSSIFLVCPCVLFIRSNQETHEKCRFLSISIRH